MIGKLLLVCTPTCHPGGLHLYFCGKLFFCTIIDGEWVSHLIQTRERGALDANIFSPDTLYHANKANGHAVIT